MIFKIIVHAGKAQSLNFGFGNLKSLAVMLLNLFRSHNEIVCVLGNPSQDVPAFNVYRPSEFLGCARGMPQLNNDTFLLEIHKCQGEEVVV